MLIFDWIKFSKHKKMSSVSQELVFNILKKSNKDVVYRPKAQYGGVNFSKDKFNVLNLNTFKFAGSRDEAVAVLNNKSKGITLLQKKSDNKNKLASSVSKKVTKKRGTKVAAFALKRTNGEGYRTDLAHHVVVRAQRLSSAAARRKPKPKVSKEENKVVEVKKQ